MKFLTVGLDKGSQITRFREEAEKLGHTVYGCKTSDLIIKSGDGRFEPTINGQNLSSYDLIYLCAGVESKRRYEWYVACDYIKNNSNTKIVNEIAIDPSMKYYPVQTWFYLKQFENKIPQPQTFSIFNGGEVENISKDLGFPLIVKLSETHQGKGIFLTKSAGEIKNIIEENPGQTYLLRKFIPNDGDIRVFVVGGDSIGAMKRTPANGEFRSNISAGGLGETFDLEKSPEIKELAENAAKVTGIEIAGVDIMIDKETGEYYVLEVNTGPQFKGLEKYTRINIAKKVIEYFVSKCK